MRSIMRRVTMIYVMSSLARRPMCVALITDIKDRTRSDLDALKDRTRLSVSASPTVGEQANIKRRAAEARPGLAQAGDEARCRVSTVHARCRVSTAHRHTDRKRYCTTARVDPRHG